MRITVTCRAPDEYADPNDGTGLTEAGLYALVGALDERGFDDVQLIRRALDTWAMDRIHDILINEGQPWTSDQIEWVAEIVKQTARPIPPPDEEPS